MNYVKKQNIFYFTDACPAYRIKENSHMLLVIPIIPARIYTFLKERNIRITSDSTVIPFQNESKS